MKETRFISQNKEKWLESEKLLTSPYKDPEKLSNLFTQVVDDLSYSRTYYPNRSVRVYLNKIARLYFSIIYSQKKEKKNRFALFWLDELPQIIIYSKKQLLISLFVFLLAAAIGVFSSMKDPQFAGTILGQDYISMTNENIAKGDPMAVYKKSHQVDMVLGITFNNLMVAFRTYVFGIFLAIGSIAIILYNGIMVGCFQYFFVERGLFVESALSIWLHGTLEISSIIIAGGAGLTLGTGLIFPGTYSRLQAFQLSAMRSLKLMLGIAPIIILAGIIESFLTRYTEVSDFLKLIIILLSAVFIIGYFIVYPYLKSKSGFDTPLTEVRLPPVMREKVSYHRIKNNAELLKDTFLFYSRHVNKLLPFILTIAIAMTTIVFLLEEQEDTIIIMDDWWKGLFADMVFALRTPTPLFIGINTFASSLIIYRVMKLIDMESKTISFSMGWKTYLQMIVLVAMMYALIYLGGWGIFFLICSFGLFLLFAFTQLTEESGFFYGITKGWHLFTANMNQAVGIQFILILLSFSFLLVLSAPLIYMYTSILKWNFAETDVWSKNVVHFIELFFKTFSFYLVLPILTSCIAYLYFTLEEVSSAHSLRESISRMGSRISKSKKR